MSHESLHVIASFRARPGKESALVRVLEGLVEPSRQEPGCLTYVLHRSRTDPTRFVFVEEWSGTEALEQHARSEHVLSARERYGALLAEPPDVDRYSSLL